MVPVARSTWLWLLLLAALASFAQVASAVTVDWVTVGGAGNSADTTSYGAVAYEYRISRHEVTNAQYAELLNAVAVTDTYALYDTNMGTVPGTSGGITRSGSSGSFSYATIAGREDMPVNHVSFWDAVRFANWLHNGQPTGAQDNTTTEDGAYTLTPTGITNNTVSRNVGAQVFVTSEDEWYKAAYYDSGVMSYFIYPAGSDTLTTCAVPGAVANTANCGSVVGDLTDVGSYTGAASPGDTFDQGGNALEWNEAQISGSLRGVRGGSFDLFAGFLATSFIRIGGDPATGDRDVGFRVASLPPSSPVPSVGPLGVVVLASVLGLVGCRKLRT